MTDGIVTALREALKDPEYAAGYAEGLTLSCIASQIRVLRQQRGISQKQLAEATGTMQPAIARLEDVNYIPSLRTLLRLAEAFQLHLNVSFEPYDHIPERVACFNRENLERATRNTFLLVRKKDGDK